MDLGWVWIEFGFGLGLGLVGLWVGDGLGLNIKIPNVSGGWLDYHYTMPALALTHRFFPQGRVWQKSHPKQTV